MKLIILMIHQIILTLCELKVLQYFGNERQNLAALDDLANVAMVMTYIGQKAA